VINRTSVAMWGNAWISAAPLERPEKTTKHIQKLCQILRTDPMLSKQTFRAAKVVILSSQTFGTVLLLFSRALNE
jgi:hypothetical protein